MLPRGQGWLRFSSHTDMRAYMIDQIYLLLFRSAGITGLGIQEVARGCPSLETINVSYCNDIMDTSLIALSKCERLNTLEIRGCPLITSLGLVAIAVCCRQLSKLDIKKCCNIDDGGMIPLAHFSQNLRQVCSIFIHLLFASQMTNSLLSLNILISHADKFVLHICHRCGATVPCQH